MNTITTKTETPLSKKDAIESEIIQKNKDSLKTLMSRRNTILLFCLAFCLNISNMFAQDIITLKSGDDVEALVQEVGELEIKYKKFENPDGPNYTLKKAELFMIRYANGSKDVFADNKPSDVLVDNVDNTPTVAVTMATPTTTTTKQPTIQNNKGEVYVNFWGNLKYRSDKTKVRNVETLFYDLPDAAKKYRTSKTWGAIGGGIMGAGICVAFWDVYRYYDNNYNTYNNGSYSPFKSTTYWTGMGLVLVGSIFSGIGASHQKTAIDIYNAHTQRQQTSDISLDFGITKSGGVGLTFNF